MPLAREHIEHRAKVMGQLNHMRVKPWADLGQSSVTAYANHGRWVADCVCGGAELVTESRDFLCGSCGRSAPVEWPDEADEVEAILDARPPGARNWRRPETVEDLMAENAQRGVV